MPGAGADPSRSEPEPESAPGPWRPGAGARAGAAQKSGGSATLLKSTASVVNILESSVKLLTKFRFIS